MNRFIIYQSKGMPLRLMGQINRTVFLSLVFSIIFLLLFNILFVVLGLPGTILKSGLVTWLVMFLFLIAFSVYIKKQMVPLGHINISSKNLEIIIGSYQRILNYKLITEIKIEGHIQGWSISGSDITSLVTIFYENHETIQFVTSSISTSEPKIDFAELINHLPSVTGEDFTVS